MKDIDVWAIVAGILMAVLALAIGVTLAIIAE